VWPLYLRRYSRHTTACHLLRAGVDINTIRGWLGHVSLETTNIYAEVDLEMKAKALARCDVGGDAPEIRWRTPQLHSSLSSCARCSSLHRAEAVG